MSIKQKVTNEIKLSNNDLKILKEYFSHCFDKTGKFQIEKFQKYLSKMEINFSTESYGLEWLGKSYARLLASDAARTLLKEDENHNKKEVNKDSQNLLIKGDNLEVLKHLINAYYEKIKMIYIDPPYNTGTDGFVYQDDRKFTIKELQQLTGLDEEKAKRILDFTQSKSNSHSAWLTFMYPRLYIAKQLLKDDGVIFVSIDDNEIAQLRILMDEVYGEENFIGAFKWNRVAKAPSLSEKIRVKYEYVVCYKINKIEKLYGKQSYNEEGPLWHNPNVQKELIFPANSIKVSKSFTKGTKSNKYQVELIDDIISINGMNNKQVRIKACSAWSQQRVDSYLKEGKLFQIKKNVGTMYTILDQSSFIAPSDLISKHECSVGTNTDATAELNELNIPFDHPKPVSLIKYMINMVDHEEKTAIILDLFAGSGTTGDAVMQLNAEDGGERQYILVQLPEPINPKKNKVAYDFVKDELKTEPTIFEITKERLIRAAKKIKKEIIEKTINEKQREIKDIESKLDLEDKEEKIQQLKDEINALKEQDLGFKIYETMPIWENYNFEADELVEEKLFDENKLTEDDIKALLITWKTYDNIPLTVDLVSINLDAYTAYYGNEKLYFMHKGFTTENLKQLLLKIDSDKTFNPKSIIAFGYHFDSKSLRELSENIKSYANKKHIDIEFLIRY